MKDLVRTITDNKKYGCPFKLRAKLMVGGEGWVVNLICGSYNHALTKSVVRHPYASQLTKDEKIIIVDMTKSMVKSKNSFNIEEAQCQQFYNNEASIQCKICISFFYKRQ